MTPLPKQRISRGRKNRRRAHDAFKPKQVVQCSNCGEMRLPHRVCPHCGYYRGRGVVAK